jgi:hypothetical protein
VTGSSVTATFPKNPFKLLTLNELDTLAPAEWLIEPLFQTNSQVILFGPPGEGKSFVALSFALSLATGKAWLGRQVKKGPVIYVAAEGGRGIRKRIAAWQKENDVGGIDSAFFLLEAPQLASAGDVKRLLDAIHQLPHSPVLIVLDTFSRTLVGGDENAAKDVGIWIEGSRQLQEKTGATVLALHHTVKRKSKNRPAAERGSSALRGAADTMLAIAKDGGYLNLSCEKQKDEEEFESILLSMKTVSLDVDDDTKPLTSVVIVAVDGEERVPSPARQLPKNAMLALEALRELNLEVVTKQEWLAAIKEKRNQETPDRTFHNWVDKLEETGLMESPGTAQYRLRNLGATATTLPSDDIKQAA